MNYPTRDQLDAATTILKALGRDDDSIRWHLTSMDTNYLSDPGSGILAYLAGVADTILTFGASADPDPQPEDFDGLDDDGNRLSECTVCGEPLGDDDDWHTLCHDDPSDLPAGDYCEAHCYQCGPHSARVLRGILEAMDHDQARGREIR